MKLCKKLFFVLALALLVVLPVSCIEQGAHVHTYGGWTMTTLPTETTPGKAERECTCGHTQKMAVASLTDTSVWTVTEKEAATCQKEGIYVYTSVYGELEVAKTVQEHEFSEWTIVKEPTLTEAGMISRTCKYGDKEEAELAALSDTSVWSVKETVAASCAKEGTVVYTSLYGDVTVVTPTVDHEYGEWTLTVNPTMEATGTAERTCKYGEVNEAVVPALSDTSVWTVKETVAPTCAKEGKVVYTSVYGEVTVITPTVDHEYESYVITTNPTMEEAGKANATCKYGEVNEVVVPALSDETVWTALETVAPTCAKEGEMVYTSVYGQVTVAIPTVDHEYGEWTLTVNPTMEATGTAERTCKYGEVNEAVVPALSDETVWTVKEIIEPNYAENGATIYQSEYGEVSVAIEKLVPPYLGKHYIGFELESNSYKFKVISSFSSRYSFSVDQDGKTFDYSTSSWPFGYTETVITVAADGAVTLTRSNGSSKGYVDYASAMIVGICRGTTYADAFVLFPSESTLSVDNLSAASWNNALAVQYTDGETVYSAFVYNEKVYFNVTFTDEFGNEFAAANCVSAPIVYVKDANGNLVASFVNDGTNLVESDTLEGTYKQGETTLFVSGYGVAILNGVEGTYVKAADGADYTISLMVDGVYYEVKLNKADYTCEVVKPMVTITFDAGDKAVVPAQEVNKGIALVLPNPTNETYVFKGWFYDAECTKAVEEDFVPTTDVTLYAKWATKVVIYLENILEGDDAILVLGEGDVIGEYLPAYDVDEKGLRIFAGWYLDAEFTNSLPEDAVLTVEDNHTYVYAKWNALPPYYGEYVGSEIWSISSGNSGGKTLKIDAKGNMTGVKNGIIVSYDPETQKITWKANANATTTDSFYFDERTGIIAGLYSSNTIGNDFYVFTKYQENGKLAESYGVKAPITPGSSVTGYYARFINVGTKLGQLNIFMYNDHIYSDITIEDVAGNSLSVSEIKNSKTVVVKDATTGDIIIAIASKGTSFAAQSDTQVLDAYFGTYQNGAETIVLDGVGGITYGSKTGTYVKTAEDATYGFDVFLENNTEYYQLTLNGQYFTMDKPMVNVDFVVGEGHTPIASVEANMNVVMELPNGADEGWVFNGWFLDQEFTQKVSEEFIPTQNTTLYAKYSVPAIVTVVFNNGEENQVVIYSVGDVTNIERPKYAKHVFEGWFTTAEFTEGTEWTSGNEIFEDVTIYAKWSDAPVYNNTYLPIEIGCRTTSAGLSQLYAWSSAILAIDEYGFASCKAYPFNGEWEVKEYNEELGTLQLVNGSTVYYGYIDKVSGIIVISRTSGANANYKEVFFLTPFENKYDSNNFSTSYWNSGDTRAIDYTYEGTTYSMFVNNNQVYFNVAFKDAAGLTIKGENAYQAPMLSVYDANGELIAKFGYNDITGTMQELDGFQGKYTNTTAPNGLKGTLELNGIREAILNGKKGTYDLPEEADATFMFDVYVQGVYYEVSVNKETMTYEIVKPMVTLSFDAGHKASDMTITTNKYIYISLPVLDNPEYTFQGWYLDAEFTQKATEEETYRPTSNITLYAKWSLRVKLNFVYGNGLDNVEVNYTAGDVVDMNAYKPESTYLNGMIFKGWFTDEECTIAFTGNTFTEATTLYALWEESDPYTITNKGIGNLSTDTQDLKWTYNSETKTWESGNKEQDNTKSVITIVALTEVTVTLQYAASSESDYKWDYFHIDLNGSQKAYAGGSSTTLTYKEYTVTLKAGDTLTLIYEKDSNGQGGLDQAFIKNLTIDGVLVTEIA